MFYYRLQEEQEGTSISGAVKLHYRTIILLRRGIVVMVHFHPTTKQSISLFHNKYVYFINALVRIHCGAKLIRLGERDFEITIRLTIILCTSGIRFL